MLLRALVDSGLTEDRALERIYLFDVHGLLTEVKYINCIAVYVMYFTNAIHTGKALYVSVSSINIEEFLMAMV